MKTISHPRKSGLALAVTACALILTGCTSASYMDSSRTNASPGSSGNVEVKLESVNVKVEWPQDTTKLLITTASSSGCPLTPQSFEGDDSKTLVISEKNDSGGACPADLHYYTFTVDRPASWTPGVELEGSGSDTRVEVSVK